MNDINNRKDSKIFELYTFAELSYQSHFKNKVNDIDELFPVGWYEKNNYELKIEIITEAIKTNTLIVNTKSYLKILEGLDPKIKNLINE